MLFQPISTFREGSFVIKERNFRLCNRSNGICAQLFPSPRIPIIQVAAQPAFYRNPTPPGQFSNFGHASGFVRDAKQRAVGHTERGEPLAAIVVHFLIYSAKARDWLSRLHRTDWSRSSSLRLSMVATVACGA